MSLYYIKGSAGTGKSTICKALQELGYEVHDADDDDMGSAYDNATNEKAKIPPIDERTPEWFTAHSYRMIPEAIEALHEKAKDKTIFLCGTGSNEDALWHLFDHVLFLDIDEATLRQRIATRAGTNNDFGQSPHELELILQEFKKDKLKKNLPGVVIINATQPIKDVVKQILDSVELASG